MKRAVLVAVLLVAVPPSAAAQENGVFVDPDSPAGKEYAVPLDQARGEAAGTTGDATPDEPLFGEGIEPGAGSSSGQRRDGTPDDLGDTGGSNAKPGQARPKSGSEGREGDGSFVDVGQSAAAIEAAAADGSDGLLTAGIAAAVLLAGLMMGFGLRRLLRGS